MTGLLLLGLVPASAAPVATDPVHLRLCGQGFDALALPLDRLAAAPATEAWAVEAALAQNAVLSAYAATGDVLPVAIGAGFSGPAALGRYLGASAPALAARMQRLAGQAEYILRLLPGAVPAPAPPAAGEGGAAFLRRRSASRERRRSLGQQRQVFAAGLAAGLAGFIRARIARPQKPGGALLDLCLLVDRCESAALVAHLGGLAAEAGELGLTLRLIGPCAPHSFVERALCDA